MNMYFKFVVFAFALSMVSACSIIDNYDDELMNDEVAEASSDSEGSSSSVDAPESSSADDVNSSSADAPESSSNQKAESSESVASSSSTNVPESSSAGDVNSSSADAPESSSAAVPSSASFACGSEFEDTRDGQFYGTVKIGNQCWFQSNLNFETDEHSYCYMDEKSNCDTYGRLYKFDAAVLACPEGSHLPTREDWTVLANYINADDKAGTKLKAASGWSSGNGTDEYGFAGLPGGKWDFDEWDAMGREDLKDGYLVIEKQGIWWSATEATANTVYIRRLQASTSAFLEAAFTNQNAYSIRCLVD